MEDTHTCDRQTKEHEEIWLHPTNTAKLAQLPVAWQSLSSETQQSLAQLKFQRSLVVDRKLERTAFTLLAKDYMTQRQYHYVSGLYNYLLKLEQQATQSPDNNTPSDLTHLLKKLQAAEDSFLKSLGIDSADNSHPYIKINPEHRAQLARLRCWCEEELKSIDQKYSLISMMKKR